MPKNELGIDVDKILLEVRANLRLLDSCVLPHAFDIDMTPGKKIGGRSKCSKCGGEVESLAKRWYEQGLRDAK
jgi:hypothetical protein